MIEDLNSQNQNDLSVNDKLKEVIEFQVARIFAGVSRNYLCILEDLRQQHETNFDKLRDNLPTQYTPVIDMSDYLNVNSFGYYRKRTLDSINSSKRDLESILKDLYEILAKQK